ncbi:MAG: Asp-tRNA(Asn)/Glu-tRNA(Gln) amidotransferase subunit GatA [Chlamydiae bacterium]|nr:Asp-tRNA(Asn)/Glu-tRNA(Gln) amidotransferase subunit GatA [Chlamydiota bacterium]
MQNLTKKSAKELHEGFLKKEWTAVEIAKAHLQAIDENDNQIQSFLAVFSDKTLAKAVHLDQKLARNEPMGKMAGVPIAVKDNIHIRGEKTTAASKILQDYVAPFSATVVEALEEADALLIGKTNLDEFAMGSSTEHSAYKVTQNPLKEGYTPGGSSGGSAAAVAAHFAPLSLGSDTGGSIRQPASFTGLIGMKPTYGRVSRYGLIAFGSSLDQIGPFSRTVYDNAWLLETISAPCKKDPTNLRLAQINYKNQLDSSSPKKKIGVPFQFLKKLEPRVRQHFDHALAHYKELGYEIQDIDLSILEHSVSVYYVLATAEASSNLARYDGITFSKRNPEAKTLEEVYDSSRSIYLGHEVKQRILLGTMVLSQGKMDEYYMQAARVRQMMKHTVDQILKEVHFIMTPTSPNTAFRIGGIKDPLTMYLQDIYTIFANLTGHPAISIPMGMEDGLPLGLQIVAPYHQEMDLYRVSRQLEVANKHHLTHK